MKRLRFAYGFFASAVLSATLLAATTDFAAGKGNASGSEKTLLAAQFRARLADSLLVLVPSEEFEGTGARADRNRSLSSAFDDQRAPRSRLVAALLASDDFGLGNGSSVGAAGAAAGHGASQQRGRRPVSPNRPPDRPPGPPDGVPPGPPDGVPPGPPDRGPKGRN